MTCFYLKNTTILLQVQIIKNFLEIHRNISNNVTFRKIKRETELG